MWEGIPQKNTELANLGNHPVSWNYVFVQAPSCMNNTWMCTCTLSRTYTKWNHCVYRVETRVLYKYCTEWKARLSHFWIPRPFLEASSKQCLSKAHGVQKESLRVATNEKDPLNQEILLQRFQSRNFYLFCSLFVCLEEGRPTKLQQKHQCRLWVPGIRTGLLSSSAAH